MLCGPAELEALIEPANRKRSRDRFVPPAPWFVEGLCGQGLRKQDANIAPYRADRGLVAFLWACVLACFWLQKNCHLGFGRVSSSCPDVLPQVLNASDTAPSEADLVVVLLLYFCLFLLCSKLPLIFLNAECVSCSFLVLRAS